MSWSRKIFRKYSGVISRPQTEKWLAITRVVYFFSVGSIGILLYAAYQDKREQDKNQREILMGRPVIEDPSAWRKLLRNKSDHTVVYEYDKEKGWITKEYSREEYQQKLERDAYRKSYEAQKAELEAGKTLPTGSLVLVDEKDIKKAPTSKSTDGQK